MADTRFLRRIYSPPSSGNPGLDRWLNELVAQFNQLPNFSTSSTSAGPNSIVSAPFGSLYFEGNSSVTTKLWFKSSGNSSIGWSAFSLIG